MYGQEILWLFGIGLKFLAQTYQMRIHRSSRRKILVSPDLFQKTIAAESFARMANKVLQ